MHFLVVGAGSVGCYVGGILLSSGQRVRFLGRENLRKTLSDHDLHISRYNGLETKVAVTEKQFMTKLDTELKFDVALICVKSQDTKSILSTLANCVDEQTTLVSLQNGLRSTKMIRDYFPENTVLAGMIPFNVVNLGQGHFHCGSEGNLTLPYHKVSKVMADGFAQQGLCITQSSDIESIKYGKLLMNLNNSLNALSGMPLKKQLEDRSYRRVLALLIKEALLIMKIKGIRPARVGKVFPKLMPAVLRLPNCLFLLIARGMLKIDPQARSSMWEDLKAKRSSEIDYLNGEIVILAHELGIEASANSKIVDLITQAFAKGTSPAFSGEELLSLVVKS